MTALEASINAQTVASPIGIHEATSNIFKIETHLAHIFHFYLYVLHLCKPPQVSISTIYPAVSMESAKVSVKLKTPSLVFAKYVTR